MIEVVRVTEQDIAEGKRGSPSSCPIALALHRAHPDSADIEVCPFEIVLWEDDSPTSSRALVANTSGVVQEFIHDYDIGIPMKPIRFTLAWEVQERL